MGRKFIDCRDMPSDLNCSVDISADNEDELLEVADQHAVVVHGHTTPPICGRKSEGAFKDGTPSLERPRRAA